MRPAREGRRHEGAAGHGGQFGTPCGRTDVLLWKCAMGLVGASNDPDSDRLTYHDKPDGTGCPNGGKLLAEVQS